MIPLDLGPLLPLRALRITLRFTVATRLRFFHQAALTAFIHTLMSDQLEPGTRQDPWLWIDAPDSGRAAFAKGDSYRFVLFASAGREALLQLTLDRLRRLPASHPGDTGNSGFGRNLRFVVAHDHFTADEVGHVEQLSGYDADALTREVANYHGQPQLTLRLTSPARLLKPKPPGAGRRHGKADGEARYIRDRGQLSGEHQAILGQRLYDSLAAMLRSAGAELPARGAVPLTGLDDDIGWYDMAYYDARGRAKPMGGIIGRIELRIDDPVILPLLVLGQYTGIGQRRGFGWGRYRLERPDGQTTLAPRRPSRDVRRRAADAANLELAWRALRGDRKDDYYDSEGNADAALAFSEHPGPVDALLAELSAGLRGDYRAPRLQGRILRQPGKAPRPLAVPPFADRVAQRAVMQILQADCQSLLSDASFGYRRGVSREQARDRLQILQRQGYHWVFEADIANFFDSVSHRVLETRLRSLLPDDPVIELILDWVSAPVNYQGRHIERPAGLPQGAPISPLLANLLLDDFDSDLEQLGFKLIRYADDFVIACRSRERAEQAADRVRRSLDEIELELKPSKTRITHFDQGFRFLGYTFLGGLAVDGPRQARREPGGRLQLDDLPPASWLACMAREDPSVLDPAPTTASAPLPPTPDPGAVADGVEHLSAAAIPATGSGQTGTAESDDEPCMLLVASEASLLSTRNGRLRLTSPVDADGSGQSDRGGRAGRATGQVLEHPWSDLGAVLLLGRQRITGPTLSAALEAGVPLHFATRGGRYQGCLANQRPGPDGHRLWLRQQQAFDDPGFALAPARELIAARIHNQTEVIRQRSRQETDPGAPLVTIVGQLRALGARCPDSGDAQHLLGLEGRAAALYFDALRQIVPEEFDFQRRRRRPPPDPFNALLSLGYTLLYQRTDSVLRAAGLLPEIGLYHASRGRHAALASDLMEPFRHLVERQALTLLRRGELRPDDFLVDAGGHACRLTRPALRRYLSALSLRCITPMQARGDSQPRSLYQHLWRNARQLIAALRTLDDRAGTLAAADNDQRLPAVGDQPPAPIAAALTAFRLP